MDKNQKNTKLKPKIFEYTKLYTIQNTQTQRIMIGTQNISQERSRTYKNRATPLKHRVLEQRTLGHRILSHYIKYEK